MNSAVLAVLGLAALAAGYVFYSKFIAERIYRLDSDFVTPAHAMRDDHDYVPTHPVVLWGNHFTGVAGAAPIIGPAIAVIWGWLPAVIWVVVGTIFLAGVHDFGALWASVRNRARSIGALTEDVVNSRARTLFMIVTFLLLLMVNAVFGVAIAEEFIATPSSVVPMWSAMPLSIVIGLLIYRLNVRILWPTVVGTILLYVVMYFGDSMPVRLPDHLLGLSAGAQWILILFLYAGIASLLPVWLLLQPRGYISGIQLFVGLGLMYGAVLASQPVIVAPAINADVPTGTAPVVPLLFVTIACGAISGFHGLVAAGTTSKQLNKETDARLVGYLASVGEGALALVTIIAATAGFATLASWRSTYSSFGQGGIGAFVQGGANILGALGLPVPFGQTLLTVMAVLFASTTMDAGVRLQRYIVQEWGAIYGIPALQRSSVGTLVAVGSCLVLAFGAGGPDGSGGMIIWPLFGTTNQLLAGLTLLVVSVMLLKLGRPTLFTMIPMFFVTGMALLAALYQLWEFYATGQYLLGFLDVLIVMAALLIILEALAARPRPVLGVG